jgi:poly-gamma-glutamate synthesis protein (capsule biosynthesis protein)
MARPEEIRLLAVGDVMLGDHPVCIGHGVRSQMERRGMEFPFQFVSPFLRSGDITFGNLETVLSDNGFDPSKLERAELRGRPAYAKAIANAGFNVLSLANNHIMQHGGGAFGETVQALRENNIFCVGLNEENGESNVFTFKRSDLTVSLIAYSLRPEVYSNSKLPYALGGEHVMTSQIRQLAMSSDFVIVSLHWGEEYLNIPGQRQITLAEKVIDAGAALIIGHHPHVLQGIKQYNKRYVAYSLGNFVFDKWQRNCRESLILECIFNKQRTMDLRMWPILINRNYQPIIAKGKKAETIRVKVARYSQYIRRARSTGPNSEIIEYEKMARKAYLRFRISSYLYFILHFYRYSSKMIGQSLLRAISRRVRG